MNAPLPESIRQALETVTLDDKYSLDVGRAFMSGVQALVKLPMLQRQRDALQGKNTAGFISGYRGSPLGSYDQSLWKAKDHLKAQHIVFQPGVNEELAATALWGTQQLGFAPPGTNKFDGVFGIWYGKGPGVDRCSDVFKHANMAGTTPWGGVLAVAGDDHVAKSSTAAHQSDHIFKACGLPVFFPASVQDILDQGLHALALSRFAGIWSGMKTIQEIVESSATAHIDPERVQIVLPEFVMPPGGVHIRWPDTALEQEARLFDYKWYAALAYIRANKLNHNVIQGPNDRFGLIASGKTARAEMESIMEMQIGGFLERLEQECHLKAAAASKAERTILKINSDHARELSSLSSQHKIALRDTQARHVLRFEKQKQSMTIEMNRLRELLHGQNEMIDGCLDEMKDERRAARQASDSAKQLKVIASDRMDKIKWWKGKCNELTRLKDAYVTQATKMEEMQQRIDEYKNVTEEMTEDFEETILSMCPRYIEKAQVRNLTNKYGHQEWKPFVDKLIIEFLCNRVPPTCIQLVMVALSIG